jgi:hypothetical protein
VAMAVDPVPANAKNSCKTVGMSQSCSPRGATSMARAVRHGTRANRSGPRAGSASRPCPIVEFGPDGTITSVIAC